MVSPQPTSTTTYADRAKGHIQAQAPTKASSPAVPPPAPSTSSTLHPASSDLSKRSSAEQSSSTTNGTPTTSSKPPPTKSVLNGTSATSSTISPSSNPPTMNGDSHSAQHPTPPSSSSPQPPPSQKPTNVWATRAQNNATRAQNAVNATNSNLNGHSTNKSPGTTPPVSSSATTPVATEATKSALQAKPTATSTTGVPPSSSSASVAPSSGSSSTTRPPGVAPGAPTTTTSSISTSSKSKKKKAGAQNSTATTSSPAAQATPSVVQPSLTSSVRNSPSSSDPAKPLPPNFSDETSWPEPSQSTNLEGTSTKRENTMTVTENEQPDSGRHSRDSSSAGGSKKNKWVPLPASEWQDPSSTNLGGSQSRRGGRSPGKPRSAAGSKRSSVVGSPRPSVTNTPTLPQPSSFVPSPHATPFSPSRPISTIQSRHTSRFNSPQRSEAYAQLPNSVDSNMIQPTLPPAPVPLPKKKAQRLSPFLSNAVGGDIPPSPQRERFQFKPVFGSVVPDENVDSPGLGLTVGEAEVPQYPHRDETTAEKIFKATGKFGIGVEETEDTQPAQEEAQDEAAPPVTTAEPDESTSEDITAPSDEQALVDAAKKKWSFGTLDDSNAAAAAAAASSSTYYDSQSTSYGAPVEGGSQGSVRQGSQYNGYNNQEQGYYQRHLSRRYNDDDQSYPRGGGPRRNSPGDGSRYPAGSNGVNGYMGPGRRGNRGGRGFNSGRGFGGGRGSGGGAYSRSQYAGAIANPMPITPMYGQSMSGYPPMPMQSYGAYDPSSMPPPPPEFIHTTDPYSSTSPNGQANSQPGQSPQPQTAAPHPYAPYGYMYPPIPGQPYGMMPYGMAPYDGMPPPPPPHSNLAYGMPFPPPVMYGAPGLVPGGQHPMTLPTQPLDPLRYSLLGQLEYYFSPNNVMNDMFLRQHMDAEGWIDISVIASFRRVQTLTQDLNLVREVMGLSMYMELSSDGSKVRMANQAWEPYVLPGAAPSTAVPANPSNIPTSYPPGPYMHQPPPMPPHVLTPTGEMGQMVGAEHDPLGGSSLGLTDTHHTPAGDAPNNSNETSSS